MFLPHPRVKLSIVGSLRDREVACSASDRQGSNFESCVWRTVSSHSSHHQKVLLARFSLYVHKGGLKPDSFHDREVAFSASDRQGSNFESCVGRAVSSHSSHHQKVLLVQFSLYVHKGGLKPHYFIHSLVLLPHCVHGDVKMQHSRTLHVVE